MRSLQARALLFSALVAMSLGAAGQAPATRPAAAAPLPPAACPDGAIAGCNKGMWSLNGFGVAAVAILEQPATYRICIKPGSKVPVEVWVDQKPVEFAAANLLLFPAASAEEAFTNACALVTGKFIHLQGVMPNTGRLPAFGEYQRIEEVNPLKHLFPFMLQLEKNKDAAALLAFTDQARLFRVCLGPISDPPGPGLSLGQRHILVDDKFPPRMHDGAPRGWYLSDNTCVDVSGKKVALYGPWRYSPVTERVRGFVAY